MKKFFIIAALLISCLSFSQITKTEALAFKHLTTAQISAYTPSANETPIVYNSDTSKLQQWNGSAWVNLDAGTLDGLSPSYYLDYTNATNKPTTIAGYGITDYNSLWDTRLALKSTTDLTEGANLYYTEARVSANADVVANTEKTGITTQQADDIAANNLKVSDINHVASSSTTDLTEGANLYYTEARVGAKIITDVTQSFVNALSINASTLDGVDSSQFIRNDVAAEKFLGNLTFRDNVKIALGTAGAESEISSDGTDTKINLKSGDLKIQDNGTTNFSWNGKQLSLLNTETILTPAIQIGENGRDTFSYGVGITTAMTHTSVDFNAYCDYNLINPTILEAKGYGAFDASPRLEGTNPINHFYGYQARQRWANSGTLPTTSIFNSMSGFMNGPTVEAGVVENVVGFLGNNTTGAGSVLNQYGVYIRELTKGSVSNYGIYSLNDNYLKTVTSDEFTGGGSGLINVDAETLDGLNSPQFLRSDIDTYFSSPANGGVNIMENSYLFFGDNKEVDLGFGGANDMYFNLTSANNLFIRNNTNQTIATFAQATGNFTSLGNITSQGTGTNTFAGDITVPAEAYGPSWTTNEVPTKIDVRNEMETKITGSSGTYTPTAVTGVTFYDAFYQIIGNQCSLRVNFEFSTIPTTSPTTFSLSLPSGVTVASPTLNRLIGAGHGYSAGNDILEYRIKEQAGSSLLTVEVNYLGVNGTNLVEQFSIATTIEIN